MADEEENVQYEDLRVERLISGDRPSILALGINGATMLKASHIVVFMVDVLGRVHLMPPASIQVLARPCVSDEDLNKLPEEAAIQALIQEEAAESKIIDYLKRRSSAEGTNEPHL